MAGVLTVQGMFFFTKSGFNNLEMCLTILVSTLGSDFRIWLKMEVRDLRLSI